MGWCGGTEVFDSVAFHILDEKGGLTPLITDTEKERVLTSLIKELGNQDWDTEDESKYFDHPIVQKVFKKLYPHIYDEE